ncbi:MAG: hypothetical protein GY953_24640 [bacterium]|nr:hypothetical protein [bacterium]
MPCCLILLIALLGPRVAIVLVALFTAYFEKPFDGLLIPFLGFLFLPFTTLAYAWAINTRGEVAGVQAVVVVIAVLADLGVFSGSEAQRRKRRA